MNVTKCFLIEQTNRTRRELRRYHSSTNKESICPGPYSYHNAHNYLDVVEQEPESDYWPHDDPRWPTKCECGYEFTEQDEWQVFTSRLYVRPDTGEEFSLSEAPPGAIWHASWLDEMYSSPDGKVYGIKLPNGSTWIIDSVASNCTMPDDKIHKCWVRHGMPPMLTVDKNGHTCNAGAGSIQSRNWHGFLIDGELREC